MIDNTDTLYPSHQRPEEKDKKDVQETVILPVNQDANQSPEVSFTRHKQASEEDKIIIPDAPKNSEQEKPTAIYNPDEMHLSNKEAVRKSSGEFANNGYNPDYQKASVNDQINQEEIKMDVPERKGIDDTPTVPDDNGNKLQRLVKMQSINVMNLQDNPNWERHQDIQKVTKYKKKNCCYLQ